MSERNLDVFQRTLEKTNHWLDDLAGELRTADRNTAYRTLRAVLHVLRDRLTPEEAAQLGAQLPLLIRGMYYEGWHPAGKPVRVRHFDEFVAMVQDEYGPGQDFNLKARLESPAASA